ncbi:MAG: putative DNA binding domain-containing protein [Candidatus Methanoplasma sp.]|nr:putative DNA binding domain-containing protein [Candidatus Methanoplasma sp.]
MENQNLEWKESWRDDHLKCICAFANSRGGRLEVGRDDRGIVVGIENAKKLMEDIPSKIRVSMGIVPEVELREEGGKKYIAVTVEPYPSPISYGGKIYRRSGATVQEMSGPELEAFILKKTGKTWDDASVPGVEIGDLDREAFKAFRWKAIATGRMTAKDLEITDEMLLRRLMLMDGDLLKRAALLLFHPNPEEWSAGAYLKVGLFENSADILYQDEIRGPLIALADKAEDLVYTKYFKGMISYRGMQRMETFPVPRIAFREAVLNAIIHADYGAHNPIHIHIYPEEVRIYNSGGLPESWTEDDLFRRHTSVLRNPRIAGAFFRSGQIESWGRGIEKISDACRDLGRPDPFYSVRPSEVMIGFDTSDSIVRNGDSATDSIVRNADSIVRNEGSIVRSGDPDDARARILALMKSDPGITAKAIAEKIGMAPRNVQEHIRALKESGEVERAGATKKGIWVVREPR